MNSFMQSYNACSNLSNITKVTNDDTNTYMFFSTDMTHEPMLLSEPDYVPAVSVDNTEYDAAHTDRFTLDGRTLNISNEDQMRHYHANMSALMLIGDWLDYLRENDVYDNTRSISVADHGRRLSSLDELVLPTGRGSSYDVNAFYPLMLVKDFGATEFTTSNEFMTNADVPTLAFEGLIDNPVNPFTGKPINNNEKTAHDQYITRSTIWSTSENNGNTFIESPWASVSSDLWDKDNWKFFNENIVLDEHAFPEK